ncbi:lytic polysaccharide monooxygenase [Massilia sp. W12]|uniref:lytic polysaccharide monooxygenase n=1 Tax=Massilia sp. W12 TaxID=3126507 RepID=UPI0030CBDEEA
MHFPLAAGRAALALTVLSLSSQAFAHGYLLNSRPHLCHTNVNLNCGAIQWEPQSVEGADRYPESGPKDGAIAAAGSSNWAPLNEQSVGRWSKINLKSGPNIFQWRFTAPHASRDIRYWITKENWDPNAPISRAQFEAQPFCTVNYGGGKPVPSTSELANHNCSVPSRNGYHLILSVWDVADTVNSFYNVMDVNFEAGPPPALNKIGSIIGSSDLPVGSTAGTRVFNANGEVTSYNTSITIASAADGAAAKWPRLLATAVNAKKNGIQAGVLSGGVVTPADGVNDVYVAKDSALIRVEVATKTPDPGPGPESKFGMQNISASSINASGQASFKMNVFTGMAQTVDIKLASKSRDFGVLHHIDSLNGGKDISFTASGLTPGEYDLIMLVSWMQNGQKQVLQKNQKINLAGPSNLPVYPSGVGSYVAGSKVQGRDGRVYVCKPWPYTSWCNSAAAYYEPGFGSAWSQAWDVAAAR